ncbi:MAG: hypothetical protein AAGF74_14700 [Pseudomonadota bacterium]
MMSVQSRINTPLLIGVVLCVGAAYFGYVDKAAKEAAPVRITMASTNMSKCRTETVKTILGTIRCTKRSADRMTGGAAFLRVRG